MRISGIEIPVFTAFYGRTAPAERQQLTFTALLEFCVVPVLFHPADPNIRQPVGEHIGNLTVLHPDEAITVCRIYSMFLQGMSPYGIATHLTDDGIKSPGGKDKWNARTVRSILINEKYKGDALLQKSYTVDFLTKKKKVNEGEIPQYYVEGNHEAIIPKEIFLRVQDEMARRRAVRGNSGKKRTYSCSHCFAQLVYCGERGEMFRRIHWNNRGCKSIVWRCISKLESTGLECHARTVNEESLQQVVVKALNELLTHKESYQQQLQANIAYVIRLSAQDEVQAINEQLIKLQQELLDKVSKRQNYDDIADEIFKLREKKEKTNIDTSARDEQIGRITELQVFIKQQSSELTEFDENLTRRWIKKITIYDDKYTVEFKSGVSVDIEG